MGIKCECCGALFDSQEEIDLHLVSLYGQHEKNDPKDQNCLKNDQNQEENLPWSCDNANHSMVVENLQSIKTYLLPYYEMFQKSQDLKHLRNFQKCIHDPDLKTSFEEFLALQETQLDAKEINFEILFGLVFNFNK